MLVNAYFEIKSKLVSLNAELLTKGSEEALQVSIATNEEKINKLKQSIGLTPEQIEQYNAYTAELQQLTMAINSIRGDHAKISTFTSEALNILNELKTKRDLTLQSLEISEVNDYYTQQYADLDSLAVTLSGMAELIRLDEQRYFIHQENIFRDIFINKGKRKAELEELLKPFVANEEIKKQIQLLEKLVMEDKQKLNAIYQLKSEIVNNTKALEAEKSKIFELYRTTYQEYVKVVGEIGERATKLKDDNLEIKGLIKFNFPKLRKRILEISDGRRASYNEFEAFEESRSALHTYDLETHIAELEVIFGRMDSTLYSLSSRTDQKNAIKILMDDYFFDYWDVVYDADTLDKMSTGKASFVILMLIIGLSSSEAPILIDQPEDNLDNRSITKDLVSYLRNKKLERQIIIVTHNPNVVVNADAENIIIANQKGQNDIVTSSPYQFDYINGALEHSFAHKPTEKNILLSMGTREHIAEIVEGGKEAFKSRERKYGFRNII
jgi:hypothetical protein